MHTAKVEKVDGTLFINPGSAHSYFTNDNDPTVAILDTRSMEAEIVALI